MATQAKADLKAGTERSRLLVSGTTVSLPDWLDISWFYPEDFEKEEIIETPRSLIVLGKSVVYKFFKENRAGAAGESFGDRWRRACEEVLDNRELAPDLYLGLRLLRWIDGEPHWITEFRGKELLPTRPPQDADEVAIVMRRVPDAGKLSSLLASEEEISAAQLNGLVKALSKFHERRRRDGICSFVQNPDAILNSLRERYVDRLAEFLNGYGTFLDPFSQIAFQETKSCLEKYFTENMEIFFGRGRDGWIIDGHGDLRVENISIEAIEAGARTISISGRAPRAGGDRVNDMLGDLASLAIDFEALGFGHIARVLEEWYLAPHGGPDDQALYRFFLAASAVLRAEELFRSGFERNSAQVAIYLSLALRHSLGLRTPFLVAVGGPAQDGRADLGRSIAELIAGELLTAGEAKEVAQQTGNLDDAVFSRLLELARRYLTEGTPTVLVWPLNREEERLRLAKFAEQYRIPYLLVKCHLSQEERTNRGLSFVSSDNEDTGPLGARRLWSRKITPWNGEGLSRDIKQLLIEPVLPQPYLALYVLQELARLNKDFPSGAL